MEVSKERRERNLIVKAWQRWVTWASRKKAEKGCFSVYVGEERKRFKVKTELVNHPQFKKLLDDAEMEYGFVNGPIWLPCSVELFFNVMAEIMVAKEEEEEESTVSGRGSSKGYSSSSFALCSPSRLLFNLNPCYDDHQDGDDKPPCAYQLLGVDPHSSK
ncbi:hypothetical protein QN277_006573 [Acacia crassicarpa]|uniref:SAUR family protein n=1 Tax=Acacia crassicarpa TaxID=499986 RepID=A0AAE1M7Y5_9FABA|nr:hypothetical protein QN277_006573 [Acacia crassicarpa]